MRGEIMTAQKIYYELNLLGYLSHRKAKKGIHPDNIYKSKIKENGIVVNPFYSRTITISKRQSLANVMQKALEMGGIKSMIDAINYVFIPFNQTKGGILK